MQGSTLAIREIATESQLLMLRTHWDDLLTRSADSTIFQTWEWNYYCRQHFGNGRRLMIAGVWDGNTLVGLAPFEVTRLWRQPIRRLQFVGTEVSDYLDLVVDATLAEPVTRRVREWLMSVRERWDILDLQHIPHASTLAQLWPDVRRADGWRARSVEQDYTHHLPLPESYDDFLSHLGKSMRKNLTYYDRLLHRKMGDVVIGRIPEHETAEAVEALFRLHADRWTQRGFPGVFSDERVRAFHRELAGALAERKWLGLYGIRVDGALVAVKYNFTYKGITYSYSGGFDSSMSQYRIGSTLLAFCIRDAIDAGCREYDFLRGSEQYKDLWTDQRTPILRVTARSGTIRSAVGSIAGAIDRRIGYKTRSLLTGRLSGLVRTPLRHASPAR